MEDAEAEKRRLSWFCGVTKGQELLVDEKGVMADVEKDNEICGNFPYSCEFSSSPGFVPALKNSRLSSASFIS
jgi:hypothetical protein